MPEPSRPRPTRGWADGDSGPMLSRKRRIAAVLIIAAVAIVTLRRQLPAPPVS